MRYFCCVAAFTGLLCVNIASLRAEPLPAGVSRWLGLAGIEGLWTDASKWDVIPTPGSVAIVDNGGYARVNTTIKSMAVICGDTGTGRLRRSGGDIFDYDLGGDEGISLTLGNQAGSQGDAQLENLVAHDVTVGNFGAGTISQLGGTNIVQGVLTLGKEAGSSGTYTLSRGTLTTPDVIASSTSPVNSAQCYVGFNGSGTFYHDAGTYALKNVYIGYGETSQGRYELAGSGRLSAAIVIGHGELVQSAGLVDANTPGMSASPGLSGGCNILSSGRYEMRGGQFNGKLLVAGTFIQEAGAVSSPLSADSSSPSIDVRGRYELRGGLLAPYTIMSIRGWGEVAAEFVQTGGVVGPGTFGYSSTVYIGDGGPGTYTMAGGSMQGQVLCIGGWQHVGTFNVTDQSARIEISNLAFSLNGRIRAVPGTVFHFTRAGGGLGTHWATAEAVAELANVTFSFEAAGLSHSLAVRGRDLGACEAGYDLNYALGRIIVGEKAPSALQLRAAGMAPYEAQYVDSVLLGAGSTLDLAGRVLYYKHFTDLGGTLLLNGGKFIQVPDADWLIGDANTDGKVTDADYTIWAEHYGQVAAPWAYGDFNGDGSVTDADYTLWADNCRSSDSPVPEPASLVLLAISWLATSRRRIL